MNLSKRLTVIRSSKGITQKEMNEKLAIKAYDHWESGRVDLKLSQIQKVCKILDVSLHDLFAKELVIKITE